jgi:hypothetical protein
MYLVRLKINIANWVTMKNIDFIDEISKTWFQTISMTSGGGAGETLSGFHFLTILKAYFAAFFSISMFSLISFLSSYFQHIICSQMILVSLME